MTPSDHDKHSEFRDVAEMLERERPELGELELDRVKRTAMAGASRRPSALGRRLRSQMAIVSMVAVGVFMSGSGAALGIASLTATDSASVAQYGKPDKPKKPKKKDKQEVLGDVGGGGPSGGQDDGGRPTPTVQRTRQSGTTPASELPFTGYASIPVLLLGLALLSTGLVLRRNMRSGSNAS